MPHKGASRRHPGPPMWTLKDGENQNIFQKNQHYDRFRPLNDMALAPQGTVPLEIGLARHKSELYGKESLEIDELSLILYMDDEHDIGY